jgi:DNA-binding SARP family transcriptional activator
VGSKQLHVRVHLWRAFAAHEQKRWADVEEAVRQAVEAASTLGGPTALALEGPPMVAPLKVAASRGVAPDFIAAALDLLDRGAAQSVREIAAPPEPVRLPAVMVRLLGGFSIVVDGTPVESGLPAGRRARELLSYLCLYPAGRRRSEVATDIWPDAEAGQDLSLIHTTIHRVRQAVFPELIVTETTPDVAYRLNPDIPLDIDVRRFEENLQAAARNRDPRERRTYLARAISEYVGPFLPDCYAEWADIARHHLEVRYTTALAQLADLEWKDADYRSCIGTCQRMIEVGLADDVVHCRIMECYERLGEPLAGIVHFNAYTQEHSRADGGGRAAGSSDGKWVLSPSPDLTRVYQRLRQAAGAAV